MELLKSYQLKDIISQYIEANPKPKISYKSKTKKDLIDILKKYNINPQNYQIVQANPYKPQPKKNVLKKFGVIKNTEEEQKDFIKDTKLKNPLEALKEYVDKEGKLTKLKLQEHQIKFIKQMIYSNLRGTIAFHSVGSGKTLTAVVSSYLYLMIYPNNRVIVISPSSILYNFIQGMQSFGIDIKDLRYSYFTYDQYVRQPEIANNALLIIDEAHNFRTYMNISDIKDPNTNEIIGQEARNNMKGYKILKYGAIPAHKVLLLTGTPFVNSLYDIENLISMIEGRMPIDMLTFQSVLDDPYNYNEYFGYKISYYPSQKNENFPERINHNIPLFMTDKQEEEYNKIKKEGYNENAEKKPNSYFAAERYATNKVKSNPKIKWITEEINKKPKQKFIIYSSLYDAGVKILMNYLDKKNIKWKSITGRQNASQKEDAKLYFNGYNFGDKNFFNLKTIQPQDQKYINDEYRILIITKAGAEGVDTINCQNIILLDSQWNDALSEQIIARAVRFKSHFRLPLKERYVNVYRLFLCSENQKKLVETIFKPNFNDWVQLKNSITEENQKILKYIKASNEEYLPTIKEMKLLQKGNDKTLFIPENTIQTKHRGGYGKKSYFTTILGWDDYKNLKSDEERKKWRIKKYSEWFAKYGKETVNLENSGQTIDIWMYVLAKSKTSSIDNFIELFGNNIKLFESYQSKLLPYVIKAEEKLKRKMTDEEQAKIYAKLLNEHSTENISNLPEIKENINKATTQKELQQYFTNEILAKYVINKTKISKENKQVNVLEPTAGGGNLIKPLLEMKKDINIELIELDINNRNILSKIQKEYLAVKLLEQRNFLLFIPSKRYDYIFMNPPFHIRKGNNALIKKDIYDIDFVKRAYAMLKKDGELVAITSKHWELDDRFKNWLKSDKYKDINIETMKNEKFGKVRIDVSIIHIKKLSEIEDNDILKEEFYNAPQLKEVGEKILDNEIDLNKKTIDKLKIASNKLTESLKEDDKTKSLKEDDKTKLSDMKEEFKNQTLRLLKSNWIQEKEPELKKYLKDLTEKKLSNLEIQQKINKKKFEIDTEYRKLSEKHNKLALEINKLEDN